MPSPNQSKHCPVYTLYIQQPDRIYIWPQWMENNKQNIYLSLSVATRNKGNVQCRAYHASLIISVIREHAPGPHFGSASAFFPRSVRGDDAWTAGNTRPPGRESLRLPKRPRNDQRWSFPSVSSSSLPRYTSSPTSPARLRRSITHPPASQRSTTHAPR